MLDVLIYFWDDRDGPAFCGWWFGPKVGGDQVWAYCPDKSMTPPASQWKIPYDGPVDHTFTVGPAPGGHQPQQQQQGAQGYDANAEWRRQQIEEERRRQAEQEQRRQAEMARQQQEAQARQEEARRREEERRRYEEDMRRRRYEEEQRRREDERRRQEEERRRQEELARQQREEMERRRQEDERRRQEQTAVINIRKVISRVRSIDEEGFPALRQELEAALAQEGPRCGASQSKMAEEVQQTIQQATERFQRAAEQRAEEERRRKEREELAAALLQELTVLVGSAESKVEALKAKAVPLIENGGLPADSDVKRAYEEVVAARGEAHAGCRACADFLVSKRSQVEEVKVAPEDLRMQLVPLQRRIHEALRELAGKGGAAEAAGLKAVKRQRANKVCEKRAAMFAKYDKDGDGRLSRGELIDYAKGEFGFVVTDTLADRIMKVHGGVDGKGVAKELLQRAKIVIGVAREEERSRLRKERAEKRRLEIEAKKAELQRHLVGTAEAVEACRKAVEEAEATMKGLPEEVQKSLSSTPAEAGVLACASELHALVGKADEAVAAARKQLEAAIADVSALCQQEEKAEEDEAELKALLRSEARPLSGSCGAFNLRLDSVLQTSAKVRAIAGQKELADLDRCRDAVRQELRKRVKEAGKGLEELFAVIDKDGDGAISEADLLAFLSPNGEAAPEAIAGGMLARLLSELAEGGSTSIGKEEFPLLAKAYYKVCTQTVMTSMLVIKDGKTLCRFEPGDVLIAEEDPEEEDKAKVMRIHCKTVKEGTEGYVSICGNAGTQFLEQGGDLFKVLQPVGLTKTLEVTEAEPLRTLEEGELLQVIKGERKEPTSEVLRMKVRARVDGAVGWVTMANSDGAAHLKRV